jgi:DNA-directed RNA polymerase specialized sigma24 family protein
MTTRHNSSSDSHLNLHTRYSRLQDKEAFNNLYDTYAPAIYGVLLGWVKQESIAQVILQQTFQAYASDCDDQTPAAKPFICLLRIARKEHTNYIKNQHTLVQMKLKEYSSTSYATSIG